MTPGEPFQAATMILPPLIERPACATACWIERSGYWFAIGLTLIPFLAMASVYPRFAVRFAVSGAFAKIVAGLGSGPGSRYQRRQRQKSCAGMSNRRTFARR